MNIFPLHLVKSAENSPIMVELKSGDTYSGTLEQIDKFMNIKMNNVTMTSKDGESFLSIKEIYIKGFTVKYFQLQEGAVDKAIEEAEIYNEQKEAAKKKNQQRRQEQRRGGGRGGKPGQRSDNRDKRSNNNSSNARGRGRGK